MPNPIRIVVALPAEARPIITRFRLSRIQSDQGFPIYRYKDISLIISGTGKVNAAAAVQQLHAFSLSMIKAVWVNVGIVGHPVRALGEVFLARHVIDASTGDNWTIPMGFMRPCDVDELLTVDSPDLGYKKSMAVDMEAAGFYPAAAELSESGLVQCLKIVSDNPIHPADRVNGKLVRRLIEDKLDTLENLLRQLGGNLNGFE
jgi:nucleoside phosphorylase